MKPTRGTFASCWACAASGDAAVKPAIALMKSRRRFAYPRAPERWRFQVIKT